MTPLEELQFAWKRTTDMQWCPIFGCYHNHKKSSAMSFTQLEEQLVVLEAARSHFKITAGQAERYGLAIDEEYVFVPLRDSSVKGGWVVAPLRWKTNGIVVRFYPLGQESTPNWN